MEFKLPDAMTRKEIFKLHLKNRKIDAEINLEELALLPEGYSVAGIRGVCRKAALKAVRNFMEDYGDRGDFNFLKTSKQDLSSIVK